MTNRDVAAAWNYHERTKHSLESVRASRHYLDWDIKPRPFKVYPTLRPIPLPRELPPSGVAALSAVARGASQVARRPRTTDLVALARALHLSAGMTRKKLYPSGAEVHFRAAACTGALYHIDVYVICGDLPGLRAGVYHFGPHNFSLHELRAGDYRGTLVEATGSDASVRHAPVILAYTSTYWRNSWKYQARTYRHCFWDAGTVLANLLAVTAADGLPARVVCGFVDEAVNTLLGLDPQREVTLALVALGCASAPAPTPATTPHELSLPTLPLSPREVDYPAIREMHAASSLQTPAEVAAWHAQTPSPPASRSSAPGRLFPLQPLAEDALPGDSIDQVILRRGSTRRFSHRAISFEQLSTMMECVTAGVPSDFGTPPTDAYVVVNAVTGLPSGRYFCRHADHSMESLREEDPRRHAGFLGLGQELSADASANVYLLCRLDPCLGLEIAGTVSRSSMPRSAAAGCTWRLTPWVWAPPA
jgi:SagB-type dehydrogenase family enzyme